MFISCSRINRRSLILSFRRIARSPNPSAPGVPGSGKNWALGAAAYIACWLAWITMVLVLYELVYSFWRRWRVSEYYFSTNYIQD